MIDILVIVIGFAAIGYLGFLAYERFNKDDEQE